MKRQIIFAAISAALMSAPFVDAAAQSKSGFSSSRSSSSKSSSSYKPSSSSSGSSYKPSSSSSSYKPSSSSSSSSYKPSSSSYSAPKRDYAPTPAPTRVDTTRSTSNSGLSGFGLSSRKAEVAQPRASDYAQTTRVTPQSATPYGSTAASPAPAQPKTGFATTTTSSTKKKLAGAAGATALGGALYVAGSNQDAVAAYEASQQPAPAAPASTSSTERATAAPTNSTKYDTRTASVPAHQPAPQVIVVKEQHYPRNDSYYDVQDAYREGVRDAQRNARIHAPSSSSYEPSLQAPRAQVTQSSAPANASVAKQESGIGSAIMWAIVFLMIFGAMGFFLMQVYGGKKSSAKPAARRSNYTL